MTDKNLGHATAYGYAKSKGYTGTEEEFAELMASYAEVAESAKGYAEQAEASASNAETSETNARTSAQTASAKASEASASASNAQTSASNAQASATSAGTSASSASASAQTASTKASEASDSATSASESASTAVSAKDDAVTAKEEAETAKADAETAAEEAQESAQTVANKADKDGTYPDMTVGGVMSSDGSTDSTPYLYRASGGGVEVGTVEEDSIVGGTVAWNQLMQKSWITESTTSFGLTITNNGDGTVTIDGTVTDKNTSTIIYAYIKNTGHTDFFHCVKDHKYLFLAPKLPSGVSGTNVRCGSTPTMGYKSANGATIANCLATGDTYFFGQLEDIPTGAVFNNYKYWLNVFDLTQMFGTSVADYIYSLEQSTAGAGVAFFRKLFPNDYYEYNAGELMHVSGVSEHVMRGKNLNPNEGVNYTINNSQRFFMKAGNYVFSTDNGAVIAGKNAVYIQLQNEDGTVITKGGITSTNMQPNGTETYYFGGQFNSECAFTLNYDAYMLIGFNNQKPTNFNALQIELGARATAYEPYREPYHYPLDSSLTLRGIPKLSDGLYFDGDTYEADGTVTRKYGVVDLGTLNWVYDSVGFMRSNSLLDSIKRVSASSIMANIISTIPVSSAYRIYNGENGIGVHSDGNLRVRIDNMGTDAASFKTAMSGVMLVYELATPTTESAEPYESIQKVSKYGTEEYVSTGIVPVGHVTKYPTDIVAKVNGLPSDFSTLIAPTESGFKATRAYSVNQFIIVDNQLYRVTSAIASGATITVGTNVTATTVADILTALLNA